MTQGSQLVFALNSHWIVATASSPASLFLFFFFFFGRAAQRVRPSFPNQGSNSHPLHWKPGVLTTGSPRKPQLFQYTNLITSPSPNHTTLSATFKAFQKLLISLRIEANISKMTYKVLREGALPNPGASSCTVGSTLCCRCNGLLSKPPRLCPGWSLSWCSHGNKPLKWKRVWCWYKGDQDFERLWYRIGHPYG